MVSIAGSELADAKDKLSKADSSSSDSDEDTPHKRKKPITHADKPSEEVSLDVDARTGAAITLFLSFSRSGGGAHGGETGGGECEPEAFVPHCFPAFHNDSVRAFTALRYRWTRSRYRLVSLDHWTPAAGVPHGKQQ